MKLDFYYLPSKFHAGGVEMTGDVPNKIRTVPAFRSRNSPILTPCYDIVERG